MYTEPDTARRVMLLVAMLLAVSQVSVTSANSGSDNRAISNRLDATLRAIHEARQQPGQAATISDRVSARRFAPYSQIPAQAPAGAASGLLELLVLHTAGLDQLRSAGFVPQATVGQVSRAHCR